MKTKTKLMAGLILFALLFLPTSSASAQTTPNGDVILFGQNYTLESGETLEGSLAVIGGNASIEEDATVTRDIALIGGNLTIDGTADGNVALIGGNLTISGEINGDIVIVGGQVSLSETAVVNGDIATMGGQVDQAPGAEVSGEIVNNAPPVNVPGVPNIPNVPGVPNVPNTPQFNVNLNPFWTLVNVAGRALAVASIGMLLTLFLQPQLDRVANTIVRQPVMAGAFGLLTLVVAPLAILIMVVTLILIPVAFIAALIIPLAWLFGMVAFGQEIGDRFTKAINQTWAPVLTTGFGTFLLVGVTGFIGLIPCAGWLISFVITLVVMGGVMMTLFGTRPGPGTMIQPMEAPAAS